MLLASWLALEGSCDEPRCLAALRRDPRIEYVEVDSPIFPVSFESEPLFIDQWALENQPSKNGHFDVDLDASAAWSRGADGMGVLVAVLDTGVAITHTDLAAQIWQNPLEIANNGIDDDNNGFIDDINGGNSVWRDGNVNDVDGHGTACAGLIAASPNNEGLVGLAPNATILPVRIFGKGEEGSFVSHAADGIVYAVDQGARVLSNSWTTGTGKKRLITEAIEYAHTNNALFVASAGNSPIDADEEGFFPASSNEPNVLSVAASDRFGDMVDHPALWASTFGLESVDISAPGDAVLSTYLDDGLVHFAGTSAAAPYVAGIAALLWSTDDTLTNLSVKSTILDSAEPADHSTLTGGRANAGHALRLLTDNLLPFEPEITQSGSPSLDTSMTLSVANASECQWYFPDSDTFVLGTTVDHTFHAPGDWTVVSECADGVGRNGRASWSTAIRYRGACRARRLPPRHGDQWGAEIVLPPGTEWARFLRTNRSQPAKSL